MANSTKLNYTASEINSRLEQVSELSQEVGDLPRLETEAKDSLVDAINEVKQGGGGGADLSEERFVIGEALFTDGEVEDDTLVLENASVIQDTESEEEESEILVLS